MASRIILYALWCMGLDVVYIIENNGQNRKLSKNYNQQKIIEFKSVRNNCHERIEELAIGNELVITEMNQVLNKIISLQKKT